MVQAQADSPSTKDATPLGQYPPPFQDPGLPQFLTPFIGRAAEVDEICHLLNDPGCRLLTLVGTGGIGKTRLVVQVMQQLRDQNRTVAFVDLQPVRSAEFLISAMVDALNLPHSSQDDPKAKLLRFLTDRDVLLVLDNFEHLLDGVALISDLIQAAPGVKLLLTSRVVLHLQEEWLYPLGGLRFPDASVLSTEGAARVAEYDAVRLFVSCARRLRPHFQLATEANGVVRVCQLVEGMPLAIELAAAWAKTLTADAIAEEIERDVDFLTTPLRNVSEKHRSIQIVFQRSWQLLTPEERDVFKRLSIFRGGFDRTAAVHVAGASLPVLVTLVDKSLLHWQADGRYAIHELLRQYAEEQLAQSAEVQRHVRNQHSRYYANFLGDQHEALIGEQQQEAMARIKEELDNIRAAWRWSVSQNRMDDIGYANLPWFSFCQRQSRYAEGIEMLAAAFEMVSNQPQSPDRDKIRAELLTGRGWLEMRLGHLEEASTAFETACALYASGKFTPKPAMGSDPRTGLPLLAVIRGDYDVALDLANQAWEAAAARQDRPNLTIAGYGLTSAAIAQGRLDVALQFARETLGLTKLVGSRWMMAYIYNHLGEITQGLADLPAAKEYYQASYTIRKEFNDPEGMAVALCHLGDIALWAGNNTQAQALYQQSLDIYQGIGDRGGLVRALQGLGMAAHRLGEASLAGRHLQHALQTATEAQLTPLVLSVLVDAGTVLVECGGREWGAAALQAVQQHPASDQMTQERVRDLLTSHGVESLHTGQTDQIQDLGALINTLMAELSAPKLDARDAPAPPLQPVPKAEQFLIEPLSEREQEVLALIAAGLKNREIASKLYVTLSTIKAHSNNIYRKLDVTNRVQAISRAQELGLL